MNTWNEWGNGELDFLRENYGKLTASQIAKSLNRSRLSVYKKAEREQLLNSRWESIKEFNHLSDAQKGWIAGILDGEGWIGCDKRSQRITIQVNNTCRKMVDALHCMCGGSCYTPRPPKNEKHKQSYVWALSRRENVLNLLTTVYPFLITKRGAAERAFIYVGSQERLQLQM